MRHLGLVVASIAFFTIFTAFQVAEPELPPWIGKLEAFGETAPEPKDAWVLELWSAAMGDHKFFFRTRPQALPNGMIRLSPYTGAGKKEMWWLDWPSEGTVVIRRLTAADTQ